MVAATAHASWGIAPGVDINAAARGRLQAEVRTNSRIEALNIGLSLCVFDEGRREINSGR